MHQSFLTNKGKLTNVVTDGDIRRSLLKGYVLEDKIKLVKTKKFVSVKKTHDFIDLQRKIAKYKLVPIVNKTNQVIKVINNRSTGTLKIGDKLIGKESKFLLFLILLVVSSNSSL